MTVDRRPSNPFSKQVDREREKKVIQKKHLNPVDFKVVAGITIEETLERIANRSIQITLNDQQIKTLEYFKNNPTVSVEDAHNELSVSVLTIRNRLFTIAWKTHHAIKKR